MSLLMTLSLSLALPVHAQDAEAPDAAAEEAAAEAEAAAAEAAEDAEQAAALAAARAAAEAARITADEALARVAALEAAEAAADEELVAGFKTGKGLRISSEDGAFSLNTHVRGQFRAVLEENDEGVGALGFQIRRARLTLSGNMGSEHVGYKLQLGFSPADVGLEDGVVTTSPLLDLYVDLKRFDIANIRVGQFKAPYSREQLTSSGALNMVDRSLAHNEFTLDRDIGVAMHSTAPLGIEQLRYSVGLMSGEGRNQGPAVDAGLLYVARVDVLPVGTFADLSLGDLGRSEAPMFAFGAAVALLDEAKKDEGIKGSTPADGGTSDYAMATADGIFKLKGFSANGAVHWRRGTRDPGQEVEDGEDFVVDAPRNGWGWFLQTGWQVRSKYPVDVVGRYSQTRGLGDTSLPNMHEAAFGVGWYVHSNHLLKLQTDVAHVWEEGMMPHGETRVWAQLQVAY